MAAGEGGEDRVQGRDRIHDPRPRQFRAEKKFKGTLSPGRIAWVRVVSGLWVIAEKWPSKYQPGSGIAMRIPIYGTRYIEYSLTGLTEAELIALRDLWTLACELALPVVRERDQVARDAAESGDDSHGRSYRAAPEYIVRERAKLLHALSQQGRYAEPPEEEPEEPEEDDEEANTIQRLPAAGDTDDSPDTGSVY